MYNKAILIGRIGKTPTLRYTGKQVAVMNFSMATTEYWYVNDRPREKTTWHNIVMFGKSAETYAKKLETGDLVAVEGKIVKNQWKDKDGNTRYSSEVEIRLLRKMSKTGNTDIPAAPEEEMPEDVPEPAIMGDDVPF